MTELLELFLVVLVVMRRAGHYKSEIADERKIEKTQK